MRLVRSQKHQSRKGFREVWPQLGREQVGLPFVPATGTAEGDTALGAGPRFRWASDELSRNVDKAIQRQARAGMQIGGRSSALGCWLPQQQLTCKGRDAHSQAPLWATRIRSCRCGGPG